MSSKSETKESFCKSTLDRFDSIFQRKPSAFKPLDGLRAIATYLVVGTHSFIFVNEKMANCAKRHWVPLLSPFANGDLGVDIFFVLSGFLIGYYLLKECE
jgi:peptidoglycan/LPS O-acetylase OafA/YrhL